MKSPLNNDNNRNTDCLENNLAATKTFKNPLLTAHDLEEKICLANNNYLSGYTCSQAVFCAFSKDLGIDEDLAKNIFLGFGGGFGGMQEVCGAFSGATAVISYYFASNGANKAQVYKAIRRAGEILKAEYGGITCRDILKHNPPQPFKCAMKVKDSIIIISKVLGEMPSIMGWL